MSDILSVSSAGSSTLAGEKRAEEAGSYIDRGSPLPEGYGDTRVVLLPRDPRWMYTYWEVAEGTSREIKAKFGEDIFLTSQPTIRMHEVEVRNGTARSLRFLDVAVVLDAKNWYLTTDK